MKKVLHREFYYEIPDISGFPPSASKGFHRYAFIDEQELNEPETSALLQRILSALHYQADVDIKIISCKSDAVYPLNALLHHSKTAVICFGLNPSRFQLQGFERIHHLYDLQGMQLLFANSLKSYTDEASKKILWALLKELFNP